MKQKSFSLTAYGCMALFFCAVLFFSACAAPASAQLGGERALISARQTYLSSSLVVTGICTGTHLDSDGHACSDLTVEEIIAGSANENDVIHCTQGKMTEGEEYLLYLEQGSDVFHTEDMASYTLLSGTPLHIEGGVVDFSGASLPLDTIKDDIAALDSTVQMPANTYFYKHLADLVEASDEIFIGTPVEIPALCDMAFRAKENGTSIENTMAASIVTVQAYGSIKGSLKYGDELKLVYSPAMIADVIDASTLTPMTCGASDAQQLSADKVYLFFLVHGPDAKQNYYFSINPIQGNIGVKNEYIAVPYPNVAISSYVRLSALVREIHSLL